MTKQEAIALEALCEKHLRKVLDREPTISLALNGRLKIILDENSISFDKEDLSVYFIKFHGYYDYLQDAILAIQSCIKENKEDFDKLIWSYEHQNELKED